MTYGVILLDAIEKEKANPCYSENDRMVLRELLEKINAYAGTQFQYLAELEAFNIHGSGAIVAQYITRFSSETARAYLTHQLVADKVVDCDKLVLQLYLHFKDSDDYISMPGISSPAHIYYRYDNAFKRLRPKRLKPDFLRLAQDPRDAFYLPFTMRMLASWKPSELKDWLVSYLDGGNITAQTVGLCGEKEGSCPSLQFIKSELKFTAIAGLKYYPSPEVIALLKPYAVDANKDIRAAVTKALMAIEKHYSKPMDMLY